ncbi:MAG: hypothetical protein LKM31_00100 [Sphingobium sp.]|jgi:conjugal transfer mating pair stabilization protein TraG|nr:hypothetical protein [Sphingobium sp.]
MHALETYNAAVQVGTADGATAEAAREGTSVYGRTREAAGYDFAERSGKLDAQREVGHDGTRSAARIGEQRRQADNAGFAEGAAAAGMSVNAQAAHLDSFIRTLSQGPAIRSIWPKAVRRASPIAPQRAADRIVDNERLTACRGCWREPWRHHVEAADRHGAEWRSEPQPDPGDRLRRCGAAGLINESQFGAFANGRKCSLQLRRQRSARIQLGGFQQSARNDTSTRFEAGKQAGPDTIEHFLSGGEDRARR